MSCKKSKQENHIIDHKKVSLTKETPFYFHLIEYYIKEK
jgi:hypothetical protein